MLLHVGGVDQQVEGYPGQHLVNMRVVVFYLVLIGLFLSPFGDNVAEADHFHKRGLGEVAGTIATLPQPMRPTRILWSATK